MSFKGERLFALDRNAFCEILTSTYGPGPYGLKPLGPYGQGPLII